MLLPGLNEKEVAERGLNNKEVWYVVNLTKNHISGFPAQTEDKIEIRDVGDPYKRIAPVFLEKEHAETVKYLFSKTAYVQNDKLDVESEIYQDIAERIKNYPEFQLQLYDSERGEAWLNQYKDFLSTREFEENRNKELESKTLDELFEEDDY
jgi:hypothetical protein